MELLGIQRVVIDPHVRQNLRLVDQRENYKKTEYLLALVNRGEKMVVYLNSRQKVVQLAELLRENATDKVGQKICYYHGGLSSLH